MIERATRSWFTKGNFGNPYFVDNRLPDMTLSEYLQQGSVFRQFGSRIDYVTKTTKLNGTEAIMVDADQGIKENTLGGNTIRFLSPRVIE